MKGICMVAGVLGWLALAPILTAAPGADSGRLDWSGKENRVDATFQDWSVQRLLSAIAGKTHWEVYLEPGVSRTISANFRGLKTGEALSRLMGPLSFAVVPATNGVVRLYVFESSMRAATGLVPPAADLAPPSTQSRPLPRELVVVLKPGARESIDALAKRLGAKVVGRVDSLHAYRLEFADDAAAQAAVADLSGNTDVQTVEPNYSVAPPPQPELFGGGGAVPLTVKPRLDGNRVLVGVVDTAVQPEGSGLKDFIVKSIPIAGDATPAGTDLLHGTAMSEQILATGAAALKPSNGLPIGLVTADVFGGAANTSTFQIVQGLYAVAEQGVPVVNLSLGGDADSQVLRDAVAQLTKQGVVILAAAGNQPVTTPTFPAADPGVIAVTAVNSDGSIASYANRGTFVDAAAPGNALVAFGGQSYYVVGTSVATANASGIAASLALSSGKIGAPLNSLVLQNLALRPGGP